MKHPSKTHLFLFPLVVLLLGACASNEDKIVGKWKDDNVIEMTENGGHIKVETDGEDQYLANGKTNSSGDMVVTLNRSVRIMFTYVGAGDWEIRNDDLFLTINNMTVLPVQADDMAVASEIAAFLTSAATGISVKSEIIELTNTKLRLEDDDGNISKYRRVD